MNGTDEQDPWARSRPLDNRQLVARAVRPLIHRKWLFLQVFTPIVLLVLFWSVSETKRYRARSEVILDPKQPNILGRRTERVVDLSETGFRSSIEFLMTQAAEACGTRVLEMAVQSRSLLDDAEFAALLPRNTGNDDQRVSTAIRYIKDHLTCHAARGGGNVIQITTELPRRRLAYVVSYAVAEAFIAYQENRSSDAARKAERWLDQQLEEWTDRADEAEKALQAYRREHRLLTPALKGSGQLVSDQLSLLTQKWNLARLKRVKVAAELDQLVALRGQAAQTIPLLPQLEGTLVQSYRAQAIKAKQEEARLRQTYGPEHPKLQQSAAAARQADAALRNEIAALVEGYRKRLLQAEQTEKELERLLANAKREAIAEGGLDAEYQRLEREALTAAEMCRTLTARKKEVALVGRMRTEYARLLTAPTVPTKPSYPRLRVRLLFAFVLGVLLAGLAVMIREVFDDRLRVTPDSLEDQGLPMIGQFPHLPEADIASDNKLVLPPPDQTQFFGSEACRHLRTHLMFTPVDRPIRSILITSPERGEGKTTIAAHLALSFSQCNKRVVLVDLDLRRPRLHALFPHDAERAKKLFQLGTPVCLDDIVQATPYPNLSLVSKGTAVPNPAETCHNEWTKDLLSALRSAFDMVIVDTAPILPVTDALILAQQCDAVVVVARSGTTSRSTVLAVKRSLEQVGVTPIGFVINDVADSRSGATATDLEYTYGEGAPS